MRASSPQAIAVVVLLVLAGCAGSPGAGESGPSPDEFPSASAINQSVFDRHAAVLANTSFTLTVEKTQKDRNPSFMDTDFAYRNHTTRYLVEPGASQYRSQLNGWYYSGLDDATVYSDGSSAYVRYRKDDEWRVEPYPYPPFNESSESYLWSGWFDGDGEITYESTAINATYEREGVETFRGDHVMRYEATGVDALPDWVGEGNASSLLEEFSATLLLDADGVVRHYRYEFVYVDYSTRTITRGYSVTDVGSTDVRKPEWASNVTSGS